MFRSVIDEDGEEAAELQELLTQESSRFKVINVNENQGM